MNDAGPSLLLARHEHGNAHHNHLLQHQKLHNKRQTAITTATAQATAVTEVIQTISVVQQVDVNTDGSTFAVQTLPASNYPSLILQSGTTTTSESPSSTDVTSAVSTALGSQPSSSGQAVLSSTSSTEVTSTSIPSSFSSLIPNANSTTGTGVSTGSGTSTSTASAGNGEASNNSSTPPTSTIVGGVVGGVAGLAAVLFLLLFVLRWKKKSGGMLSLGSVSRELPPTSSGGGGNRGSERGFYRVSGKKLPSVLQHGGDGYGGGVNEPNPNTLSGSSFYPSGVPPMPNPNTLSGTSFYRDEHGFYGGQSSPPLDAPVARDSGIPMMRPSPARTPVTEQGPFVDIHAPVPPRPDVIGRSHPSQDGSHTSRFTEEV
ncbi:adenovirus e3 region CR2 domain-containing protein [Rutstroemia sp. NJR-2017a BVV2]|nr:adenovirus e3 region CR2 domain-containing protein [Rutstroemia sp. NJR-2017a BVV2]